MQIDFLQSKQVFDYTEILYTRRRRHSQLDYVSPIEYGPCLEHPSILD